MPSLIIPWILLTISLAAESQISIIQPASEMKRPGETLTLPCKITSSSFRQTWIEWTHKIGDQGVQWIGEISPDGAGTNIRQALQGRFFISRDNSANTVQLEIRKLEAGDAGLYYCSYGFDYWGQGVAVTVSSASPSAPSLFPLLPYGSITEGSDVTIGCLAKDFLPSAITFSWNDQNNASLDASKFKGFPSIVTGDGKYIASTQANVPADDWKRYVPYYCLAKHSAGDRSTPVVYKPTGPPPEPEMSIQAPPLEAFNSPYLNATITCVAINVNAEKATLQWFRDGLLLDSGFTVSKVLSDDRKRSGIRSELVVTRRDWASDKKYSCKLESGKYSNILNISKSAFCPSGAGETCEEVQVEAIPPSYADIFVTQEAKLTCRISNIPYDKDLAVLSVTWTQVSNNLNYKDLPTNLGTPQDQGNNNQFIDATTTVCTADWNSGDKFICKVDFQGVFPRPKERELRKRIGVPTHAPVVYVLPPPSEQLALREKATLTCLVKGFNPSDVFVQWLHNDQPLSSGIYTSTPMRESKAQERYFTYSMLNINEEEWSRGDAYTCMVGHEGLPFNTTQKTIDKTTAYLDGIVDTTEDEELQTISSILSTFIILFLMSLFYSATVTVIKVK